MIRSRLWCHDTHIQVSTVSQTVHRVGQSTAQSFLEPLLPYLVSYESVVHCLSSTILHIR
jgi:hypothetical protein